MHLFQSFEPSNIPTKFTSAVLTKEFLKENNRNGTKGLSSSTSKGKKQVRPNKERMAFPEKLYKLLQESKNNKWDHIISWMPHGRAFRVHNIEDFVTFVLPLTAFRQTKWPSFQRQLHIYDFKRISQGPDKGAYYHEHLLRGFPSLTTRMHLQKIKGTMKRVPADAKREPNFYSMPPLPKRSQRRSSQKNKPTTTKKEQKFQRRDTIMNTRRSLTSQICIPTVIESSSKLPKKDFEKSYACLSSQEQLLSWDSMSLSLITEDIHPLPGDEQKGFEDFCIADEIFQEDLDCLPEDDQEWDSLMETIRDVSIPFQESSPTSAIARSA